MAPFTSRTAPSRDATARGEWHAAALVLLLILRRKASLVAGRLHTKTAGSQLHFSRSSACFSISGASSSRRSCLIDCQRGREHLDPAIPEW